MRTSCQVCSSLKVGSEGRAASEQRPARPGQSVSGNKGPIKNERNIHNMKCAWKPSLSVQLSGCKHIDIVVQPSPTVISRTLSSSQAVTPTPSHTNSLSPILILSVSHSACFRDLLYVGSYSICPCVPGSFPSAPCPQGSSMW